MHAPPMPADRASSEHPGAEAVIPMEFGLGVNLQDPPHKLAEGYCRAMLNMYFPRETKIPTTRPGLAEWATATGVTITAVHTFRVSESVSWLCFTGIDTTQHLYYIDGDDAVQVISHDLGSLLRPTLLTFNGCLLVLIAGAHVQEWQGYTSASPAAAHGTADITVSGVPVADETITVGAQVWTWKATRAAPFQATIGGTGAASATNLATAINTDSSIVEAVVHGGDNTVCHVSARRIGTAGNLACSEASTNVTVSGALSGGVNGIHLDSITTYQAPHPAFGIVDWNQRLVVSGDPAAPDYVYFSSPQDHWQWATGDYGGGETFFLGYLDGTDITAIHEMLGDLVVHKAGQGRTIYRINTTDPDPTTWTSTVKRFAANTSALNSRCVEAATDKQVFLDTRGFSVLTGTDTYDEILVGAAGAVIGNALASASRAGSFFVTNPDENYILVFPSAGTACWCFHYGSARWTKWQFATVSEIACGCYDDSLGTVVFGTEDGRILTLDPDSALDGANAFPSEIVSRALSGNLKLVLIKQTLLDWKNIIAGEGSVELMINHEDRPSQPLFTFTVEDTSLLLIDTQALMLEDATMPLLSSSYGRAVSDQQGGGELVSIRFRLNQGAFALNGATVRVAFHGRISQ